MILEAVLKEPLHLRLPAIYFPYLWQLDIVQVYLEHVCRFLCC